MNGTLRTSEKSSPARGTWIEILMQTGITHGPLVVPRKGDVDRNIDAGTLTANIIRSSPARGTWIEIRSTPVSGRQSSSSPARGTWIEIHPAQCTYHTSPVVPRKGDVDRNIKCALGLADRFLSSPARGTWIEMRSTRTSKCRCGPSSPARGTWIEIVNGLKSIYEVYVVPRKGDVDRNESAYRLLESPK